MSMSIWKQRPAKRPLKGGADGTADIGIFSKQLSLEGITTRPYRTDRFVLAVSPTHPLSARNAVAFSDTLDYEYIGVADELSIYGNMLDVANKMGKLFKSRVRVTLSQYFEPFSNRIPA
jgi:DNA-binding transcriptional LysR family regulator